MKNVSTIAMSFFTMLLLSCATPINERPMYGGVAKNQQMIAADEKFIQESISEVGSREAASQEAAELGWNYYYQKDYSTAMKRFNQAWLLDPNNSSSYWGFGLVLNKKGQYTEALEMLEKAHNLEPSNARITGDYALILAHKGRLYLLVKTDEDDIILTESEKLFQEATKVEPNYPLLYGQWAVALYYHRKYAESWEKVCEAVTLGGEKAVDQVFIRRLKRKMPSPCLK